DLRRGFLRVVAERQDGHGQDGEAQGQAQSQVLAHASAFHGASGGAGRHATPRPAKLGMIMRPAGVKCNGQQKITAAERPCGGWRAGGVNPLLAQELLFGGPPRWYGGGRGRITLSRSVSMRTFLFRSLLLGGLVLSAAPLQAADPAKPAAVTSQSTEINGK